MSDLLKLSVSKTKTFLDCRKKYEFVYIHKMPRKERDYHIFGKFCHKVLEDFHTFYLNGSKDPYNVSMGNAFKNALIEYKISMTPEMKKDCWKIIDQYLQIMVNNKKNNLQLNVIACEKNFDLKIDNNIILNGMIDRIDMDADDVIHVADYKTTKNKKYLKNDWFQLLTYAYVLLSENPSLEKIRASYILLRHDFEYITTEFNREEILKIKDQYLDYAKQILSETDYAPNPTILCDWCDYLSSCDAGLKQTRKFNGEVEW